MRTMKFYRDGDRSKEPTHAAFHTWGSTCLESSDGDLIEVTVALVETSSGQIIKLDPTEVVFTDIDWEVK